VFCGCFAIFGLRSKMAGGSTINALVMTKRNLQIQPVFKSLHAARNHSTRGFTENQPGDCVSALAARTRKVGGNHYVRMTKSALPKLVRRHSIVSSTRLRMVFRKSGVAFESSKKNVTRSCLSCTICPFKFASVHVRLFGKSFDGERDLSEGCRRCSNR